MGGPISAKELARLRAGFLSSPLTASDIPAGSIDATKIDSTVAPASSIEDVNTNIDALNVRLIAEEAVTASLASVATSGAYADLSGVPAERVLHIEQHTWAGGEGIPYVYTLAHAPVSSNLFILDGSLLTTVAYSLSGADVTYDPAVPGVGVVTTFVYMREA